MVRTVVLPALRSREYSLFQSDDGNRNKQRFINRISSFPNYVAFFFQLSSTILRNFLLSCLRRCGMRLEKDVPLKYLRILVFWL